MQDCSAWSRSSFIQTKNVPLILYEGAPTRQIFLDGRPLPKDSNPSSWVTPVDAGMATASVVDRIGYNDWTWLDIMGTSHGKALHVTDTVSQAGHRPDAAGDDVRRSQTYTRSWTVPLTRSLLPDTELLELVCNENEKSSPATATPRKSGQKR